MSQSQDRDALRLLREGHARGFDLAYELYSERVFGFLVRLSRSRALAEDLFQHTFLHLAEAGPHLRPDSDLRAWLFTVARNAFHSHARSHGVRARGEAELLHASVPCAAHDSSRLALNELEQALARLNHEDRELLLLIGVEDLTYPEVAAVLGIGELAVRKRVSRARERLAQVLDEARPFVRKSRLSE